jgi:hypothetical protein
MKTLKKIVTWVRKKFDYLGKSSIIWQKIRLF